MIISLTQRDSVLREAKAAGCNLLEVFSWTHQEGTHAEVFQFRTSGAYHIYAQPYEDGVALPGEHHAWIHGELRAASLFAQGQNGAQWFGGGDPELAAWLNSHDGLSTGVRELSWQWVAGGPNISLRWGMQTRPLGEGRTHVVMQAGRYGGDSTSAFVGFQLFLALCTALAEVAPRTTHALDMPFLIPPKFADAFHKFALEPALLESGATQRTSLTPFTSLAPFAPPERTFAQGSSMVPPSHWPANIEDARPASDSFFNPGADLAPQSEAPPFARAREAQPASYPAPPSRAPEQAHGSSFPREYEAVFEDDDEQRKTHERIPRMPGSSRPASEAPSVIAEGAYTVTNQAPLRVARAEMLSRADEHLNAKRYEDAIAVYKTVATDYPDDAGLTHSLMGRAYFLLEDYEKAIAHYERAKAKGINAAQMDECIADAREAKIEAQMRARSKKR